MNLLNCEIPNHFIPHTEYQKAEPHIEKLNLDEVIAAILKLKNWKSSGPDDMAAKLINYGGKEVHKVIYKVCLKIWNKEQMPEKRKEITVIPCIKKKEDKMDCNNYRSIVLLNSRYKIFSKILLARFELYIEGYFRNYKYGFRKGRSTIE